MKKINLKNLSSHELEEYALSIGEKKFRGQQLFDWLYAKEASSFEEMTSLSKSMREKLKSSAVIDSIKLIMFQKSPSDKTVKFLFELQDGEKIESVLIPPKISFDNNDAEDEEEQKRLTLCVSTQVGCPLDCAFCATGTMGFFRNLSTGEIIDQVQLAKKISEKKITNLVFMGMGEPLLNYNNVKKAIDILTNGMNIPAKRITLSTAGLAEGIIRMADDKLKIKLAVSLHSLDDNIRSKLMPVNKKKNINSLLEAVGYYYKKAKIRVTFEYILFAGINDTKNDIEALVKLSKYIPCKINLINYHSIDFTLPSGFANSLKPVSHKRAEEFAQALRDRHVTVFIRSSAGEEIAAACGQLAVQNAKIKKSQMVAGNNNRIE